MEFQIRAMRETDWAGVARVYQEGIDTGIATFQTACPGYEDWDRAHRKDCRLVAEQNGAVVGWTALSPYSSRGVYAGVAEVSIYIGSDCRGCGYGTLLLNRMVRESEKSGYWTLQSGILRHNTASLSLHRKCGFREVGYREKIARDKNGIWRDAVLMERRSPLFGDSE